MMHMSMSHMSMSHMSMSHMSMSHMSMSQCSVLTLTDISNIMKGAGEEQVKSHLMKAE